MRCPGCRAFEISYRMANDRYTSILESLQAANDSEYRKLKSQAEVAERVCLMAAEALRVHREEHKKREMPEAR